MALAELGTRQAVFQDLATALVAAGRPIEAGVKAEMAGRVRWSATASVDGVSASCTATAEVRGTLVIETAGSDLQFSGALGLDGRVVCEAAGVRVGSAGFEVGGEIRRHEVVFDLPYLGKVSIPLP
jgi:hypothetical protein